MVGVSLVARSMAFARIRFLQPGVPRKERKRERRAERVRRVGPVYESRTILGHEVESRAIKMPDRHIRSLRSLKTISMGSSADAALAAGAVSAQHAQPSWPVSALRCRSRLWFAAATVGPGPIVCVRSWQSSGPDMFLLEFGLTPGALDRWPWPPPRLPHSSKITPSPPSPAPSADGHS